MAISCPARCRIWSNLILVWILKEEFSVCMISRVTCADAVMAKAVSVIKMRFIAVRLHKIRTAGKFGTLKNVDVA